MKKFLTAAILLAAAVAAAEDAKKTIDNNDAGSVNQDVTATVKVTAGMMMEEALEKYRVERKIAAYGTPNAAGTVYFTGTALVAANVNSPDFIKSRSAAYQKAYMDAIANYVMDRTGREVISTIRQEFGDNSTNAAAAPVDLKDARTTLERKADALEEAELDKKLLAAGVDPKSCADKSFAAKKEIYCNAILQSSIRKAFGSAAGCLPVQTFETRTADGTYCIGVVVRNDAVCTEVARAISLKKRPVLSSTSGISAADALPSPEEMITQFGVRLFFDENGEPALLSFAQWGSSYRGNNSREMERADRHALTQAERIADLQLTTFINSTANIEQNSMSGEKEVSQMLFRQDGSAIRQDLVLFVDKWINTAEVTGSDSLVGRGTVYRKILIHPSGHRIAVVVRCWSFGKYDAMTKPAPKKSAPQTPVKQETPGVRKGRTYDF